MYNVYTRLVRKPVTPLYNRGCKYYELVLSLRESLSSFFIASSIAFFCKNDNGLFSSNALLRWYLINSGFMLLSPLLLPNHKAYFVVRCIRQNLTRHTEYLYVLQNNIFYIEFYYNNSLFVLSLSMVVYSFLSSLS